MIEGQEGVTWDDWVALASACEEHGVEALFRSDHYISWFDENRRVLDAWATLAGLAAKAIGDLVAATGSLNYFALGRERVQEV